MGIGVYKLESPLMNAQSGLSPLFDQISANLDNRAQQHALAQVGAANEPEAGLLSRLIGGITGNSPVALNSPVSQPAARQSSSEPQFTPPSERLPTFAAAPGQGAISPNTSAALAFFQQKGLSPIAAAGLVGGFANESGHGLNTNAVNRGDGSDASNSVGIAQWNGDRARSLQQFAASRGASPSDLQTQLEFAWSELNGPESKTLAALKAASNPMQATAAALGYERPAGWTPQNPFGASTFGRRLASTVGLSKMPGDAMAYAPSDGGVASTPAGAAVAAIANGAGATTGDGTAMPIASASPAASAFQSEGLPAGGASAAGSPAGGGGLSIDQIKGLVSEPTTRSLGLELWKQSITGKNFGFQVTQAGDVIRTDPRSGAATLVYRAPVKHEGKEFNGRFLDYDPQSGSARDATPAGLPQGYRPATADERKAYNAQEGSPLFIGPDGKPGFGSAGTNVTLNNATDPIQKAAGDRFDRSLTAADAAARTIPNIRVARQQLQAGIFAGALSGEQLGLQKLAGALGFPVDTSKITNTESFNGAIGPIVLETVKGLGAGSGISNADRDFAERMVGSKSLDAPSIARLLDIRERAALATIQQHELLVNQIQGSPAGAAAYRNIGPAMRVTVPPAAGAGTTKTIGGQTYHQGPDGHWYTGQ